jgi:hypothetical protein
LRGYTPDEVWNMTWVQVQLLLMGSKKFDKEATWKAIPPEKKTAAVREWYASKE